MPVHRRSPREAAQAHLGMRSMLKSKIHRVRVTDANVDYEGSLTLDRALMEAADILPYERVQVLDVSNGARLETYVIPGRRNSGEVCVNGAAARLIAPGDTALVLSYSMVPEDSVRKVAPKVVLVDGQNRPVRKLHKTIK